MFVTTKEYLITVSKAEGRRHNDGDQDVLNFEGHRPEEVQAEGRTGDQERSGESATRLAGTEVQAHPGAGQPGGEGDCACGGFRLFGKKIIFSDLG